MRRFRFRLEQLLELRRYREREWEQKLAAVTGSIVHLRNQISQREGRIGHALKGRRQAVGPVDMTDLTANELYLLRLDQEIGSLENELAVHEENRREVQKHYADASRQRKVLDRLKEKRQENYRRQQRRGELQEMDDINTARAARKAFTG
jgi:flagellar FliJ protein